MPLASQIDRQNTGAKYFLPGAALRMHLAGLRPAEF